MQPTTPRAWVGIDVSKDTLDACLLKEQGKPQSKVFANQTAGWAKLLRWIDSQAPKASAHFCLEATNTYHQGLSLFLVEAERV